MIPKYDPYTGELNPHYEELTGEKNPLENIKPNRVLFLCSSAINITGNSQEEKNRFAQTLNTINSIIANAKNADIWLIETGKFPISKYLIKLLPNNVTIIPFWKDTRINQILIDAKDQYNNVRISDFIQNDIKTIASCS